MRVLLEVILDAILEHFYWEKLDEEGRDKFKRYLRIVLLLLLLAIVGGLFFC